MLFSERLNRYKNLKYNIIYYRLQPLENVIIFSKKEVSRIFIIYMIIREYVVPPGHVNIIYNLANFSSILLKNALISYLQSIV